MDQYAAFGIGGYNPTTTLNGGLPRIFFQRTGSDLDAGIGASEWLPSKQQSLDSSWGPSTAFHSAADGGLDFEQLPGDRSKGRRRARRIAHPGNLTTYRPPRRSPRRFREASSAIRERCRPAMTPCVPTLSSSPLLSRPTMRTILRAGRRPGRATRRVRGGGDSSRVGIGPCGWGPFGRFLWSSD